VKASTCIASQGRGDIPTMVRAIYIGIDPRLTGAAGYSLRLIGRSGRRAGRCDRW